LSESEILLYQETLYISGLRVLYKRRLWKRASLSIGAPLGKLEGGFFYRGIRETVKEGLETERLSLYGGCARGTWREVSFTENPEGYIKKDSRDGHFSLQGPHWEPGGEVS
jgi:hypothetical protein